jgi:uncharacterized membrane protein YoaK (UPF0700 family)
MISKLPKWMILGGSVLCLMGGFINAVGFLSIYHEAVTHLTGNTTVLAIAIAHNDAGAMLHLAAMIGSFMLGAAVSAYFLKDAVLRLGRRYGAVMVLEGMVLFLAAYFLSRGSRIGEYLATLACGLQNGMASTYSGATVRTTHVSGMLTDIGIMFGHWFGRVPVDPRKVKLYSALCGAFLLGGVIGTFCFASLGTQSLCIPAAVLALTGISYTLYAHQQHKIEKATRAAD